MKQRPPYPTILIASPQHPETRDLLVGLLRTLTSHLWDLWTPSVTSAFTLVLLFSSHCFYLFFIYLIYFIKMRINTYTPATQESHTVRRPVNSFLAHYFSLSFPLNTQTPTPLLSSPILHVLLFILG